MVFRKRGKAEITKGVVISRVSEIRTLQTAVTCAEVVAVTVVGASVAVVVWKTVTVWTVTVISAAQADLRTLGANLANAVGVTRADDEVVLDAEELETMADSVLLDTPVVRGASTAVPVGPAVEVLVPFV